AFFGPRRLPFRRHVSRLTVLGSTSVVRCFDAFPAAQLQYGFTPPVAPPPHGEPRPTGKLRYKQDLWQIIFPRSNAPGKPKRVLSATAEPAHACAPPCATCAKRWPAAIPRGRRTSSAARFPCSTRRS